MYFVIGALGIISVADIYFAIRYYMLAADLKSAYREMEEIGQNPEDNRILLVAHANAYLEQFLASCNNYIEKNQQARIFYENRERKLRRQIEAISHDLRTPLTAMLGYLELLSAEKMDDESREALDVVMRKAKSLQRLLADFYDLSRLELEDYHLTLEQLEVSRFIKEGMLSSYGSLEERGLEVFVECEEPVLMQADKGAMERILNNMLQNAIRYAWSYLKVSVVKMEKEKIGIVFENDTSVLKQEDVPHLFERFYMSDAARTSQGTGLGLTINKLLTEAMGGSVEAQYEGKVLQISYIFSELTKI